MKRQVLEALTRPELQAAVEQFDLEVADRRVKDQLVDALVVSRKFTLTDLLAVYSRDRLKELCRALDLDDSGREKAALIERLAGTRIFVAPGRPATQPVEPSRAAPPRAHQLAAQGTGPCPSEIKPPAEGELDDKQQQRTRESALGCRR